MQTIKLTNKRTFYSAMISAALLLCLAATYMTHQKVISHRKQVELETHQQLTEIFDRINNGLHSHIQLIRGLPALFWITPDLPQADFNKAISNLIKRDPEIRNVAAAPDMVIQYLYPLEGNEQAMGLDYRDIPEQFEAANRAKLSREIVLAGPLKLVQGGTGMISRIPVFITDEKQGEEKYWGLISVVIDFDKFLDKYALDIPSSVPIKLAIRGKDGLGLAGDMIYGSPLLFDHPKLIKKVILPDGEWVMVAEPKDGWNSVPEDIWQIRLTYYGIAALLLFVVYVFLRTVLEAVQADGRFRYLIESSPMPYLLVNSQNEVEYVNKAFTQTFGYQLDDFQDMLNWWDITTDASLNEENFSALKAISTKEGIVEVADEAHIEVAVWCTNKQQKYALVSASSLADTLKNEYLILFYDVTSSHQHRQELELMAHYDALTSLPNRTLFASRFSQAVEFCDRQNKMLALCFLDLDGFKPVNDTYGHEVGDQLLIQVASRLRRSVREEDMVSRFGGDEFAILLTQLDSTQQSEAMLDRVHQTLAQPYEIDGIIINITASSGVTFYPGDNADLDTMLRHADQTMYQAKMTGRNLYRLFSSEHNEQDIERQKMQEEVRLALKTDQLRLYFQPKVNMRTGKVVGMEALIRWLHPSRGLLMPADFLPVIEETDLDLEVGQWVMEEGIRQLDNLLRNGHKIEVSVNVSSSHLMSVDFVKTLSETLENYPALNAHYFQLEVLESSALEDIGKTAEVINMIREKVGISVALDDFGTGYSSLTHLRHLSAASIKIDKSFVMDMLDDPQDFTIVDGVVGLAESFNRKVIAEGVESTEHGLMLLLIGCDYAQGYQIARPMPGEEILDWLEAYEPDAAWIKLASETLSEQQKALKFFKMTNERWFNIFNANFADKQSPQVHWPIMSHKKCHCGKWLRQAKTQSLFEADWLSDIDSLHQQLHDIANQAREKLVTQGAASAIEEHVKLKRIYHHIEKRIEDIEIKPEQSPNQLSLAYDSNHIQLG